MPKSEGSTRGLLGRLWARIWALLSGSKPGGTLPKPLAEKRKPVILLHRVGIRWRAETTGPPSESKSGKDAIEVVVAAARASRPESSDLKVKVQEGTRLFEEDVLALISANGGPEGLDLSRCGLALRDLSRETVQARAKVYPTKHGRPKWESLATRGLDLRETILEDADMLYTRLQGADLSGARLRGADMRGVHLQGATLRNTWLGEADLSAAHLQDTDFAEADLQGTILTEAHLQGATFRNASLADARLLAARLDRTDIVLDQLGDDPGGELDAIEYNTVESYRIARKTYLTLKNNFSSVGRYEDAAWAYVKEQRMEKAALWRELNGRQFPKPAFWGAFIRWALNWTMDALTGYGETPQKPLGVAVVLATLFFPLLFWAVGALPDHGRGFTSLSPSDIDWGGWGDSLVFSLTSFGTMSFRDLQPEGTLPTILAAFEAFTGVLLFALFIFTLGNRMSRS